MGTRGWPLWPVVVGDLGLCAACRRVPTPAGARWDVGRPRRARSGWSASSSSTSRVRCLKKRSRYCGVRACITTSWSTRRGAVASSLRSRGACTRRRNFKRRGSTWQAYGARFEAGNDLAPHLSARVHNPFKNTAAPALEHRTDRDSLLADWGVHHLHVSARMRKGVAARGDGVLLGVFRRTTPT